MVSKTQREIRVLQKNDPILREISKSIDIDDIKSIKVKNVIKDLKSVLEKQGDAAAIAAIQIGKPIRLFIIAKRIFEIPGEDVKEQKESKDLVFINPKILKSSKKNQNMEEGCLSIKYVYGKVKRSEKTVVEAFDENGKKFSRGFSGLLAQIVQHETDHLNGILFTDKATDIIEITKEEYEENLKSQN